MLLLARESAGVLKKPKSINLSSFTPKIKAGSAPACRSGAYSRAVLFGQRCCRRFPETCPSCRQVSAAGTRRVAAHHGLARCGEDKRAV